MRCDMSYTKQVEKREFLQNTSKYICWVEDHGNKLIITHKHQPNLILSKIKSNSVKDLRGTIHIKVHGDINEPTLPECAEILS